ncbi:MAG: hypothetical protein KBB71_01420 [Lentimicrobiaceae bacterium]|nr:hypothetical protein [Lentimicrobiaceae bacterium]
MSLLKFIDQILVNIRLLAVLCLMDIFASFCIPVNAQPISQIRMGDPFTLKNTYLYPKLFLDAGTYFLLSFRNPDFMLDKEGATDFAIESFNTDLHHTITYPVTGSLKEFHKLEPLFLDYHEGSFYIFATEASVSTGTARSLVFRLNSRGDMLGQPVILGEISDLDKSTEVLYAEKEDTYFHVTGFYEDSARVFLYTQQYPAQGQTTTKLMVKVLDTHLTPVRHKILNLSVPPEYCEFSDILMARGELFFILTIQLPFEDKVFKLVTYNFDKDELNYFDFSIEGKKIHTLETVRLEKGNIMIRGLYAEPDSKEEVDGSLYFLFDTDNQTLLSTGSALIPAEPGRVPANELVHLQIRESYIRSNGDVVIISELYWTEVISFSDSEGKLYLRPYYHSDDLLIMSFTQTGDVKWHSWIPREFAASTEEMLGFHSLMSDTTLYIIYNDHPDNVQVYDAGRIKRIKGNFIPVLATVDTETGVYHKNAFSDPSGRKYDLLFKKEYTRNVSPGSMIWIMTNGSGYLARITFQNAGTSSKEKN